mgnify:CR=1 FL=1
MRESWKPCTVHLSNSRHTPCAPPHLHERAGDPLPHLPQANYVVLRGVWEGTPTLVAACAVTRHTRTHACSTRTCWQNRDGTPSLSTSAAVACSRHTCRPTGQGTRTAVNAARRALEQAGKFMLRPAACVLLRPRPAWLTRLPEPSHNCSATPSPPCSPDSPGSDAAKRGQARGSNNEHRARRECTHHHHQHRRLTAAVGGRAVCLSASPPYCSCSLPACHWDPGRGPP